MSISAKHLYCLHCQFDLTGLTEHRCPECGQAFDPNDARTMFERWNVNQKFAKCFLLISVIPGWMIVHVVTTTRLRVIFDAEVIVLLIPGATIIALGLAYALRLIRQSNHMGWTLA